MVGQSDDEWAAPWVASTAVWLAALMAARSDASMVDRKAGRLGVSEALEMDERWADYSVDPTAAPKA